MSMADLAIEGTFYIDRMLVRTSVGIENGRIVSIKKQIPAHEHESFENGLIIPGGIDMHVHFRDPGMTHKEDIGTGSMSALFGGVTTVLDMPNTIPPTTTPERLDKKLETFSRKSYTDYGAFAALIPGGRIGALARKAAGFKLFMGSTTGELLCSDPAAQSRLVESVAGTHLPVIAHAEDDQLRNRISESNLRDHYRSRPPESEIEAVKRLIAFSESARRPRIHVAHVSTPEAASLRHGQNVTFEVTPHHLLLDYEMPLGARGKVNPPLRRRDDRIALLKLVAADMIDTFGSDHAPHTGEEKQDDFDYAPAGIPGVETMLPLLLHLVEAGDIKLSTLVRMISEKPAEMLGVKKGRIAVGYDADLVVVDLRKMRAVDSEAMHSKCGWSPFDGQIAIFPEKVYLRGVKVVDGQSLQGKPQGKAIRGARHV